MAAHSHTISRGDDGSPLMRVARLALMLLGPPLDFGRIWRAIATQGEASDEPLTLAEEQQLVEMVSRGDDSSAEELYRRYSNRVYRFIYRRVNERTEDAEDLTIETFLTAIDLAGGYDGRSCIFVWLCGIAALRLADHARCRGALKRQAPRGSVSLADLRHEEVADPKQSHIEEVLARISATQALDLALDGLSDTEREVLLLRCVEELSVRETARIMRRSDRAIESLLLRARTKARAALLDLFSDEEVEGA